MTATQKNYELRRILDARTNTVVSMSDANTLRRAQMTLHRWAELECGDGDNYKSWAIERDENSAGEEPYMCIYPHDSNKTRRYRIADREKGALRRIDALCKRLGLYYYHQGDPRGCALYVSSEPLTNANYTNGVACAV